MTLFNISAIYFILTFFWNMVDTKITRLQTLSPDTGNMSIIANSSEGIPCSHYDQLLPYKKRTALDKQCILSFTPSSKQYFTYKVMKFEFKLVQFHLQFLNLSKKSSIHYTRCVIQPMEWIWTFRGVEGNFGGRQYLEWPPEYGTLSMGMLTAHTSVPLRMNLTLQGNCDIVIGAKNTTMRLAMAFANFTNDLAIQKDEYNYSYWCYKERIFVQNYVLYQLCLHVLCPIETIGYRCCKHTYDVNVHDFIVRCPGHFYVFGGVWWVCPFVIGFVLYLYFALIIFSLFSMMYKHLPIMIKKDDNGYRQVPTTDKQAQPILNRSKRNNTNTIWINHNPTTVFSILVTPLRKCCILHPVITSRMLRFLVAILSVSVIFIKVVVHSFENRYYIIESVKQGAPMNFLSMVAGHELSRKNFLIYLGGPYVALGAYLFGVILLMCAPKNLSDFLVVGLPEKTSKPTFVVTIDLKLREFFGSRRILRPENDGFSKIQKTMLADIFSLLNPKFWKFTWDIQKDRFKRFAGIFSSNNSVMRYLILFILMLPYLTFCFLELLFTLMCYGFPTIFTIGLLYRAYFRNLYDWFQTAGKKSFLGKLIILPGCLFLLTFVVYMFSIIFLDSFIFLSRVAIFTYTGLFANPSYTEGYLIFSITVSMYVYDSIHSINETYERLFNQTKKVCKRVSRRLPQKSKLYRKEIEGAAVPMDLYLFIVDSENPKRVEILKSVVKLTAIFLCLYISVGILTRFDGFQQLSVVTQTATTTFVCLVPKIFTRMCSLNERRQILRIRGKIHKQVDDFLTFKGITYEDDAALIDTNAELDHEHNLSGLSFEVL